MVKKCLHCGAEISTKDKFCEECGIKIPSEEEEQKIRKEKIDKAKEKKVKSKKSTRLTLIVLLFLIIVAGVVFLPTKTQPYTVQVPYTATETYEAEEPYEVKLPYEEQEAYDDYETKYVAQTVKKDYCDSDSRCSCTQKSWLGLGDTCIECTCRMPTDVPVTKLRTVTKYRTETKFKTVTKTRDVTKMKEEIRYRKVNWLFNECFYNCK